MSDNSAAKAAGSAYHWMAFLLGVIIAVNNNVTASLAYAQQADLPTASERDVDYQRDVRPILMRTCWTCHGPDEQESEFRVDLRTALLSGGESGEAAIIPGNSGDSPLIHRAAGVDGWIMPPENRGKPLSADEIGVLRAWIDAGANMPETSASGMQTDHWSFQPVVRAEPPKLDNDWATNPIDAFILNRLRQENLAPSAPASRAALIRRVYLDMLGLAPTSDEVAQFVADESPDAYAELIDRVLANLHYGERWARHWLDVVRFAESNGFETNHERPNAYRYRDWVIQALNEDLPYDEFVFAQLAGDTSGQDAATGFLVAGPTDIVKSPDPGLTLMQRQDELADMINATSTTFLGLTVGCARCHTHKFDPILQSDYYALGAVFAGVQHGERPMRLSAAEEAERAQRSDVVDQRLANLQQQLETLEPPAFSGRMLVIDDEDPELTTTLVPAHGHGVNPAGTQRGHKDDPGGAGRFPNISGGLYSWWDNQSGANVFAYRPQAAGRYRVWLSWGCGWNTHATDAQYILDRDGNPATTADQTLIATVDQQRFSDGSGKPESLPKWSGFLNADVHEFQEQSVILLRGGDHGQAITADMIVLQQSSEDDRADSTGMPPLAPPVSSRVNIERFAPTPAKFVRFHIDATNSVEPCLDELEIWTADVSSRNVALATNGAVATSSGDYSGDPKHQLAHVNDGQYGNEHSWISDTSGRGWVQIELPETVTINRIVWGRDRNVTFRDRLATRYRIEVSTDGESWTTVAADTQRVPYGVGPDNELAYRAAFARAMGMPAEELSRVASIEAELTELTAERNALLVRPMAYSGGFATPPITHRLYRGDPSAPLEEIAPDTPQVLDPLLGDLELSVDAAEAERRAKLATWITSPKNPLAARVIVNRLWHYHFGRGLVSTPSDFGAMGAKPSHPELLDWLASELVAPTGDAEPWSLKHIHRLILHSNAYQQASTPNHAALAVDRDAALLWRFPPRRLEAEVIRDNILLTSGQLNDAMFGPGFLLFVPNDNYSRNWIAKDDFGPADFRRMVYALNLRMEHDAVFGAFDCPDGGQVAPKRTQSTTPIQALNLFNSSFVTQQADAFAQRVTKAAGEDVPSQVRCVFELALQRTPSEEELTDAVELVQQFGLPALCRAMFNSSEFLFIE